MKIYDNYHSLLVDIGGSDRRYLDDVPPSGHDEVCRALAERIGLVIQPHELLGAHLVFDDGDGPRKLGRSCLYGLAIPDTDARDCAVAMLARVRELHGPGRIWVLNGMPHFIHDDGKTVAAGMEIETPNGPVCARHVVMRFFYGHEAQAVPA